MTRRRAPEPRLYELAVDVRPERADETVAWFVERKVGGLEERQRGRRVEVVLYGENRRSLERLASAARRGLSNGEPPRVAVRVAAAARAAWRSSFAEHLTPQRLTRTLVAVPTTSDVSRVPRGVRAILLEPALTFGFGEHPTTRLVVRAIEHVCRRGAVKDVLDVGTGSGILAFAAVFSGARRALGLDIDVEAVRAARRNAARNGLSGACRFATTPVTKIRSTFGLVVANIRLGALLDAAPAIARAVAPRGFLLLSGVLAGERRELERRYRRLGFRRAAVRARALEEGWALVALRRGAELR